MDNTSRAFEEAAVEVAAMEPISYDAFRPVVPGRLLHIDGDVLAYFCGGNSYTSYGDAKSNLKKKVISMQRAAGAEGVVMHLTAPGSTKGDRMLIATTRVYQKNRRKGYKPDHWEALRDWMALGSGTTGFKTCIWWDREADDGMARCIRENPNDVVATIDKDLRMCYGWHLNWDSGHLIHVPVGTFKLEQGEKSYGDYSFWHQMLMGDKADNIPGLQGHPNFPQGIGFKTATSILYGVEDNEIAFMHVSNGYHTAHGVDWPIKFAEQAMLLWIRRGQFAEMLEFSQILPIQDKINTTKHKVNVVHRAARVIQQRVVRMKMEVEELEDQEEDIYDTFSDEAQA